tara:strand:+ start:531 stop:758 length:228 start_codon:yes stop_codon:yes gene_type:complete
MNGGRKKLKNLALFPKANLTFLKLLLVTKDFLNLIFGDSFNWSKQFIISESKELPIFRIRGLTSGLELLRTILCM